jgi:hypothetical protein
MTPAPSPPLPPTTTDELLFTFATVLGIEAEDDAVGTVAPDVSVMTGIAPPGATGSSLASVREARRLAVVDTVLGVGDTRPLPVLTPPGDAEGLLVAVLLLPPTVVDEEAGSAKNRLLASLSPLPLPPPLPSLLVTIASVPPTPVVSEAAGGNTGALTSAPAEAAGPAFPVAEVVVSAEASIDMAALAVTAEAAGAASVGAAAGTAAAGVTATPGVTAGTAAVVDPETLAAAALAAAEAAAACMNVSGLKGSWLSAAVRSAAVAGTPAACCCATSVDMKLL